MQWRFSFTKGPLAGVDKGRRPRFQERSAEAQAGQWQEGRAEGTTGCASYDLSARLPSPTPRPGADAGLARDLVDALM